MSPNTSNADRERDKERERPPPRFPNFSFNKLLGGRQSGHSKSATPAVPSPVVLTQSPLHVAEPLQPAVIDDSLSWPDILDILTDIPPSSPHPASPKEPILLVAYTRAAISRLPTVSPVPRPDVVIATLLKVCAASSPTELRCAGFDLLSTYLTLMGDTLSSIDKSAFWLIIKGASSNLAGSLVEWRSRSAVLGLLTADGANVDGLQGLIPSISRWAYRAASWRVAGAGTPLIPGEFAATGPDADDCLAWCLTFLTDVLRFNAQSLSPSDITGLVDTFDVIVNEAISFVDTRKNSQPQPTLHEGRPLVHSPSQMVQGQYPSYMSTLAMSRSHSNLKASSTSSTSQVELVRPHIHRRHPSSSSLSPLGPPPAQASFSIPNTPATSIHVLPALHYANFTAQLVSFSVIPHSCLSKIITSMTYLVSRGIEVLPRLDIIKTTPAFKGLGMTSRLPQGSTPLSPASTPFLTPADSKSENVEVEAAIWEVVRNLLGSSAYAVSTARALKKLLLNHPLTVAPSSVPLLPVSSNQSSNAHILVRCAEGAARCIRLALRRAAEGRLARHWLSNQFGSYAPSGCPTFPSGYGGGSSGDDSNEGGNVTPDVNDMLQRAWGKEGEGGAWEVERISAVLPEAVKLWVGMLHRSSRDGTWEAGEDWEKERVIRECLGIVNDIIDEAIQTDERASPGFSGYLPSLGVVEGRLAGEVLMESIQCVKIPAASFPVLQLNPPPVNDPSSLLYTLCHVLSRLLLSDELPASTFPALPDHSTLLPPFTLSIISPELPTILLSVAQHLQDETLAQLVQWYLVEGSLGPSTPAWLENLQRLFDAVGVSSPPPVVEPLIKGPRRSVARRTLSAAVTTVYRGVRDHRPHRTALLELCLVTWEKCYRNYDLAEFIDGAWAVMADGIAAGAADDEPLQERDTESGSGGLREVAAANAMSSPGSRSATRLVINTEEQGILELRLRCLICQVARMSSCGSEAAEIPDGSAHVSPRVSSSSAPSMTNTPARSSSTRLASQNASSEREQSMPPLMSFLVALASPSHGTTNADEKLASPADPDVSPSTNPLLHDSTCKSLSAVLTLIQAFQTLAFSPPHSLSSSSAYSRTARAPASHQCIHVFRDLLALLTPSSATPLSDDDKEWHERATKETSATGIGQAMCPRARLAILQWLARLRADRDHRLYVIKDLDTQLEPFASLLGRSSNTPSRPGAENDGAGASPAPGNGNGANEVKEPGLRQNRSTTRHSVGGPVDGPPQGQEHGGKEEYGRARAPSRDHRRNESRSRSQPPDPPQRRAPLWSVPENLPFDVPIGTRPSEGMTTYEAGMASADSTTTSLWLPTSAYVCTLIDIVKDETDWDILTYALSHLPIQLSNKHLFCGPMTSVVMVKFSVALLDIIHSKRLATRLNKIHHPEVLAIAYHALTVLISYRRLFTRPLLEAMVEAFQIGLNRYPATVKPCLHALTLTAFELQPQMTRSLSKIIGQLSQIVTNPGASIHILELLIILGSIPTLYSNFTEEDYKRVFTVALRYIQHHNHAEGPSSRTGSHALSQHLLATAYYTIYVWFLAVKLPERPKYIPQITRNLLLANDHKSHVEVDEPTEVCFDWLARYTYGDADPKPSRSFLGDVLTGEAPEEAVMSEKTWIQGSAIITIRSLRRAGWIEMECRRPSGMTRFHCRLENVALSRLCLDSEEFSEAGNETPRMSASASLSGSEPSAHGDSVPIAVNGAQSVNKTTREPANGAMRAANALVDQPRDAVIDPSFLALQMSPYPDVRRPSPRSRLIPSSEEFKRTIRTLDRTPVIDSHTIGILYAAPGQTEEQEILGNRHGSPAYTRFLQGLGRLIRLKSQRDVYTGGLDTHTDEDGQFAYAWWNDIAQILYHTSTLMPNRPNDPQYAHKKKHVGNDYVRIIWNDSGMPFRFDTLKTEFQFANVIIEPHSTGAVGAYSNSTHEHEFFKVSCQRARGMPEFGPLGEFKLISTESLSLYVREVSLLADFFAPVWEQTQKDTRKVEYVTNWRVRLKAIKRLRAALPDPAVDEMGDRISGLMAQEQARDFTRVY